MDTKDMPAIATGAPAGPMPAGGALYIWLEARYMAVVADAWAPASMPAGASIVVARAMP